MAATKQLREENGELREEITQLKEKLDKISPGLKVASRKWRLKRAQQHSIKITQMNS